MAKRKRASIQRFETDEVQGEGSYVELKSLTLGEIRKLRKATKSDSSDPVETVTKMLVKQLVEWNWVDDDGEDLPCDEKGLDQLYESEAEYLVDLLVSGSEKELKN